MPGIVMTPELRAAHAERAIIRRCEGLLARMAGLPASANPFRLGTQASAHWARGWTHPDIPVSRSMSARQQCHVCGELRAGVMTEQGWIHTRCMPREEFNARRSKKRGWQTHRPKKGKSHDATA